MALTHRSKGRAVAPTFARGRAAASAPTLSLLAGAVALLCGAGAAAQQTAEEIVVTGSRIARTTGFTTAVPVTAVTAADLNTLKPGATVADQLDQLPQFYQTQSAQRGGGALFGGAGRSAVDLRAMGPARTLVLLDGARLSPADRDGSVHIDNIPTALLSQVEVVTGGASAAYGADALAGVVNFRLNRNYEGMDVALGLGQTEDGLGDDRSFSLAYGSELGDKWHFIGSLEAQHIDPIEYDPSELGPWFRRYGVVANPAYNAATNPNVPQRLVLPDVHSIVHTPTGRIGAGQNAAGQAVPFTLTGYNFNYSGTGLQPFVAGDVVGAATGNQSGGPEAIIANQAFNGGPYGAEVEKRNLFAGFTFDVNDSTRFLVNLLAGSTESNDHDQRGIPHLTSPWQGTIFADNPFLPASVRNAMIAEGVSSFTFQKQGTVFGQEGNFNAHEERHNQYDGWTLQLGLDKELGDNWTLQARLQRGATRRFTTVYNEVRVDREFLALDAVEIYPDRRDLNADGVPDLVAEADRGSGVVICNVQRYNPTTAQLQAAVAGVFVPAPQGDDSLGGPTDLVPIPGPIGPDNSVRDCVPMNAFGQGNVSAAADNYAQSWKAGDGVVTQEFAELLASGQIYDGYGPGPFSMAVGATYRNQWFWQRGYPQDLMAYGPPRNAPQIGIRGISPGFTGGSPNLHEFSTVPVINGEYDVWELFTEFNLPLWQSSGAQRLELDLAARYSDYSTSGGISSHKAGVNLQIAEPLRFRATVSRDVREPTFAERFNLQGGGGNIQDPTKGGQTFEITVTSGGNPDLEPEEADTVTAGFVVQPPNTGLQFSVDWYDIDLSGAVGQLNQQRIVNECFAGSADLCALITRDPTTGVVTNVRNVFLNINKARVRGIDYELLWNTEPDWLRAQNESLTFRLLAGRLLEDSTTVPGGRPLDLANQYDEPANRATASARYQMGRWGVTLQERYIGESVLSVQNFVQFAPGVVPGPNQFTIDDNTVQSKAYTDLTLTYDGELANGRSWQASLAITNLGDTDPPVIADFNQRFSAQTNPLPNNFDIYGRRWLATFRYRL